MFNIGISEQSSEITFVNITIIDMQDKALKSVCCTVMPEDFVSVKTIRRFFCSFFFPFGLTLVYFFKYSMRMYFGNFYRRGFNWASYLFSHNAFSFTLAIIEIDIGINLSISRGIE